MQYTRVVSFGDSFIYGSELVDDFGTIVQQTVVSNPDKYPDKYNILRRRATGQDKTKFDERASQLTWPALLSKHFNATYSCYAAPGASNQTILREVLSQLHKLTSTDLVVIGWTYINRWDFYYNDQWTTARPNSSNELSEVYLKYMQSELWDKFETLKSISLAQMLLREKGINFLMTCQDTLINDSNYNVDVYIDTLRKNIYNSITWFERKGFNEWADGYPRGENGHPLEQAHQAAFEYIRDNYDFTK